MVANACKSQHLRLRQERSHEFKDSLDYMTIRPTQEKEKLEAQPVLLQELCIFLPSVPTPVSDTNPSSLCPRALLFLGETERIQAEESAEQLDLLVL